MATTITIAGSINWSQAYNGYRPLTVGVSSEPAITSANLIIQTILAPPFSWAWNRSSATFTTVAGTQDYSQGVASFGFIEKASYKIPSATITNTSLISGVATYTASNNFQVGDLVTVTGTSNGGGSYNITKQAVQTASASQFTVFINHANVGSAGDSGTAIVGTTTEISETLNVLGTGSEIGSPVKISPQTDDNAGNISFRVLPIPDRVYTIEVIFQKRIPSLIASTAGTWAPIPDHYSYIYQWGFLSLMYAYNGDARWLQASQKFVTGLLGVAEGLSESQKDIFQAAWLNVITEQQAVAAKTPQGIQSRQV
jgi:hypothetical protein